MNRKNNNLGERTTAFSKEVISFCKSVRVTPVTKPMISQLIKSATSIGANYSEANNAASKTDFRNKIFIAKKEAAETKYWLDLFADVQEDRETCKNLKQECHYILMTLQKIVNTLNGKR
jgi:four helix bundle protein